MVEKYDVKERLQMDYAPRKIAVPQGGIRQEPFRVERQHLDGNHHVNNGQYISMAMAYLPENFAIRQMRAEYKKSALLHDIVVPIIVTCLLYTSIYSIVDDDKEMDAVAAIFTDMLEDIELEKE